MPSEVHSIHTDDLLLSTVVSTESSFLGYYAAP
jgi:hypothetical protein